MIQKLKSIYKLFNLMNYDHLGYIYHGNFTDEITENILKLTEANLQNEENVGKIKKRIYSIMVEGLQNITRHQTKENNIVDDKFYYGIFVIQKIDDVYFITTGNPIKKSQIPPLKELLDKINSLSNDELKKYYKKILVEGEMSDKGGAGLGLVDMARKSKNKLYYKFHEIDDEHSFFYLHTVPVLKEETINEEKINNTINGIIVIHKLLNENNFILVFNGEFSKENSVNLLSAIKGHITTSASLKNKLFYVIVEMLQNIEKHGTKTVDNNANPGIFLIGEDSEHFYVMTGNFISKEESQQMKKRLEVVNSYTRDELEREYSEILFDFNVDDVRKTGLGFIDIRLKTDNKVEYWFENYNDNLEFLLLGAKIHKGNE